jgi:tRNA/tmRNA/rRNA uracil-C5-methylase (TrmA/RlmC/RlmD family)
LSPLRSGAPEAYRTRARLAVRGRAQSPKIGIFQRASHRIADIPNCRVHHPQINAVADAVRIAIRRTGMAPYREPGAHGELRYLQIAIERSSERAQVVLIGKSEPTAASDELCDALRSELGSRLHSLWWNTQPQPNNAILGQTWQHQCGPEALRETIAGAEVFFPPGAFGQSHLALAESMVEQIRSWIPDGARVAEFYAGCGPIGLALAGRASAVRFNEVAEQSLVGLARGIAALPPEWSRRSSVCSGEAGDCIEMARGCDVVIADPPRKGLDPALLDSLVATPPAVLVYQSCSLASFERELPVLVGGGLRLVEIEPYDLFPYTEHVELLARFE